MLAQAHVGKFWYKKFLNLKTCETSLFFTLILPLTASPSTPWRLLIPRYEIIPLACTRPRDHDDTRDGHQRPRRPGPSNPWTETVRVHSSSGS